MINVRIVFQGGGAKLITLMAAAEVIEEMVDKGELAVDAVAGTSAGGIVAAMLASPTPIREFRLKVLNSAPKLLDDLTIPHRLVAAKRLLLGQPLLNETCLRVFLRDLFGQTRIQDLRYPLTLVATNLRHSEKKIYSCSAENVRVTTALEDSCALPFVFRSHKNENQYVDGGICSNFPAAELCNDDDYSHCIGMCFENANDPIEGPRGIFEYAKALLTTAIDSSVEECAQRIETNGGVLCRLPSEFGTIHFLAALHALEHGYDAIKERVRNRVLEAITAAKQRSRDLEEKKAEANIISSMLSDVWAIHKVSRSLHPYKIVKSSTLLTAYGLVDQKDAGSGPRDEFVTITFVGTPGGDPGTVVCFRVGLAVSQDRPTLLAKTEVTVEGPNGENLEHVSFFERKNPSYLHALVFLKQPIELLEHQTIKLVHRHSQQGVFRNYLKDGTEWVRAENRSMTDGYTEEFVLAYPRSHGRLRMLDLKDERSAFPDDPALPEEIFTQWEKGRQMSAAELIQYDSRKPMGFDLVGWRVDQLPPSKHMGTKIERVSGS